MTTSTKHDARAEAHYAEGREKGHEDSHDPGMIDIKGIF